MPVFEGKCVGLAVLVCGSDASHQAWVSFHQAWVFVSALAGRTNSNRLALAVMLPDSFGCSGIEADSDWQH